jgi:hypothetical protein
VYQDKEQEVFKIMDEIWVNYMQKESSFKVLATCRHARQNLPNLPLDTGQVQMFVIHNDGLFSINMLFAFEILLYPLLNGITYLESFNFWILSIIPYLKCKN